MTVIHKPLLKVADVERMVKCGELPTDSSWELVDGEIVSLSPSNRHHARVCAAITAALWAFAQSISAELLSNDPGFAVGQDLQQLRGPDIALVTQARLEIFPPDRAFGIAAPDLAIEVLSPEQHGETYARPKVAEYLAAGAKVVWLVDSDSKTVRVYEPNSDEYAIYSDDVEITLDQIATGFAAPVSSFFP